MKNGSDDRILALAQKFKEEALVPMKVRKHFFCIVWPFSVSGVHVFNRNFRLSGSP